MAELGAAFLCADLDLTLEPREDHASYIANWLAVLKNDNRAIFTAASHAQRAADFLNNAATRIMPFATQRPSAGRRLMPPTAFSFTTLAGRTLDGAIGR